MKERTARTANRVEPKHGKFYVVRDLRDQALTVVQGDTESVALDHLQFICELDLEKLAQMHDFWIEDQSRNGVTIKVTRSDQGSSVETDCKCLGIPGRLHSHEFCPMLKRK